MPSRRVSFEGMGATFAIHGELVLPVRFSLARVPVRGDTPAGGWCGLGADTAVPVDARALVDQLASASEGVFHLVVEKSKSRLSVEGVLDRDGLLAHARPLVVLVRSCGARGATGSLLVVGFDGSTEAWRVDAGTGALLALGPEADLEARREIVARGRSRLDALARSSVSEREHDASSLHALARRDPGAAVGAALAVLSHPDVLHVRSRFGAAEAARDILVTHAEGDDAVRATELFLHALYTKGGSGYDAWAADALGRLRGANVGARIARELRAERFVSNVVGVMKLFDVLVARAEEGDPALIEALATDPWSHFAGSALSDPLLLRICERAGDVRDAARR